MVFYEIYIKKASSIQTAKPTNELTCIDSQLYLSKLCAVCYGGCQPYFSLWYKEKWKNPQQMEGTMTYRNSDGMAWTLQWKISPTSPSKCVLEPHNPFLPLPYLPHINIIELKENVKTNRQSLKYNHTHFIHLLARYLMNSHLLPSYVPKAENPSFNNRDVPPRSRGGTETLTGNNNAALWWLRSIIS